MLLLRLWKRCGEGCSSGSALPMEQEPYFPSGCLSTGTGAAGDAREPATPGVGSAVDSVPGGSISRGGSLPNPRLSQSSQASLIGLIKPPVAPGSTLVSLAGLLGQQTDTSPSLSLKGASAVTTSSLSVGTSLKKLPEAEPVRAKVLIK